jgi:hypothetical protein
MLRVKCGNQVRRKSNQVSSISRNCLHQIIHQQSGCSVGDFYLVFREFFTKLKCTEIIFRENKKFCQKEISPRIMKFLVQKFRVTTVLEGFFFIT